MTFALELEDVRLLQEAVINGSENGFEFYAAGYRFCINYAKQVVHVEGTTVSEELRLDQPMDRDEEYTDVFLTVLEAVRECVRVSEPAFVVMHYMTTDDGLATYYHVVYDVGDVANRGGCRIVATVYPRVLSIV